MLWVHTSGSSQARRPNVAFKRLPGRGVGTVRAESDSRLGAFDLLVVLRDELADCGD